MEAQCKLHGILDWNNKRTISLCRLLKINPYELCAMAGLFERSKVRKFWRDNKWPSEVALQFHRLQEFADQVLFHSISQPDIAYSITAMILRKAVEENKEAVSHD